MVKSLVQVYDSPAADGVRCIHIRHTESIALP